MTENVAFKPIEMTRTSVAVYDQIKEMILDGTLKPGDKLPSERTMVDMFQKSRPPIREALRMLENDGLVQVVPGGRATVTMPDASSLRKPFENLVTMQSIPFEDLIEIRRLVEISVVGWAALRRSETDLESMAACINQAKEILDSDAERFFSEDVNFHSIVCTASGNKLAPIIGQTLHNLVDEVLLTGFYKRNSVKQKEMCEEIVDMHYQIYKDIEAKNPEQARKDMETHLANFSHAKAYYQ